MAKRPMRSWMRDKLKRHIDEAIKPAKELAAKIAAYDVAAPLVLAAVNAKYPQRDMRICKKYDAALIDDCIKVQYPNGSVEEFKFAPESGPLVPRTGRYCNSRIFLADDATAAAVEVNATAVKALVEETARRRKAYNAMIDAASTMEDLSVVWPEAAALIPSDNAVVALGPAEIALVKADMAERAVAA